MKKQKKLNSPLQDDRNIKKCQIWRFPNEEIERLLLNGKITFRYKTTGYDIFCPACNLFFKKKDDYQGLASATWLQKNRLMDRFLFLSSKSRQVSLNRLFPRLLFRQEGKIGLKNRNQDLSKVLRQ